MSDASRSEQRQSARLALSAEVRASADLASLVRAVPEGWSRATYEGRLYGLTRRTRAGGRSVSLLAEQLGGPDVVSANVHRTARADYLRPCEMPTSKVMDFLRGWEPAP